MVDASLAAQAQMRKNAEDLQDYMKDLVNWEKEVSKKDDDLKAKQSISKSLPPVRNAPTPSEASTVKSHSAKQDQAKEAPIPGGDFRAWDKFDVDAALDKLDAEAEDENAEAHRARMLQEHIGNQEKEKGNVQFKAGKYVAAIECYTRGMEHDQDSAVLPANRAMAYLKMKKYIEAERDCTTAIKLDVSYIKAWQRRATARVGLKQLELALEDYKKVLTLDPNSKTAKQEVKTLPKRILEAKEEARKQFRPLEHLDDNTQLATSRSKKVLHRIQIEEIGSSSEEEDEQAISLSTDKIEDLDSKKSIHVLPETPQTSIEELPAKEKLTVESQITRQPSPGQNQSGPNEERKEQTQVATKNLKQDATPSESNAQQNKSVTTSVRKPVRKKASTPVRKPVSKTSAAQFEVMWRQHQHDTEKFTELLKTTKPGMLPTLIKQNLCPEFVSLFLDVLSKNFLPADQLCLDLMHNLSHVKRFDAILMFLEEEELSKARSIVSSLQANSSLDQKLVSQVETAYGL